MLVAVDHFAGTGWGVACHWLGIREYGVEIMPEAIRTRRAVGFRTIYRDVWSGHEHPWLVPPHDLYIASPPCQTFSVAGRGEGRKALDQVLKLIDAGSWKRPAQLRQAGAALGDDRTALVLTPLAHIWAHRPRMVALEQVPTVLPVWEAIADVLRGLGYSVWTGNLQAEQYGVPQTRKRAILMARLDGPVSPHVPTHSRYYSRTPEKLDRGVLPWVSMAEALGWVGDPARPMALTAEVGTALLGPDGTKPARSVDEPAFTVTGGAPNGEGGGVRHRWALNEAGMRRDGIEHTRMLTTAERATLQSYPWGFTNRPAMTVHGHGLLTRGPSGQKQAIMQGLEDGTFIPRPPYTIDSARKGGDQRDDYVSLSDRYEPDAVNFTTTEAAILQSYPPIDVRPELAGWQWFDAPATTVAGDPRITAREHHYHGQQSGTSLKLRAEEAARFQTFPAPFPFQGARGKQFLQIGNAVPPLLAYAILSALTAGAGQVPDLAAAPAFVPDEWAEFELLEPVYA